MSALLDQAEAALARLRVVATLRAEEQTTATGVYMVPGPAMAELDRLARYVPTPRLGVMVPAVRLEASLVGAQTGRRHWPEDVPDLAFIRARDASGEEKARWAAVRDEWQSAWDAARAAVSAHEARGAALREGNDYVPRHGRE